MKTRLLTILLLSVSAFGTTPVTGHIAGLNTTTPGTSAFVRFILGGMGGNQPRITGTGAIAPLQGGNGLFYVDLPADASGNISGTIYSTRDAAGTGNGEIEVGGSYTAVYYRMFVYNNGIPGPEIRVHANNGVTLDISNVTPISTTPVVTAPTGDTTYCRIDGGNCGLTGPVTSTSSISPKDLITSSTPVVDVRAYAGADLGAKVNTAVAAIGSGNPAIFLVPVGGTLSTVVQLGKLHKLVFGAGTFNIAQILLADSTTDTSGTSSIEGQGRGITVLKRINSTNLDMISQTHFSTLTGTASIYGIWRARIANLTLDGNKANNATGYSIRIFGRAYEIENVADQNQPSGGIWSEGTQDGFADQTGDLEASIRRVTTILSGGNGLTFKGPNDASIDHLVSWGHAAWGTQYFSSVHIVYENDYLNTSGGADVEAGGAIQAAACQFTAAAPSGQGLLINTGAGASQISSTNISNNGGLALEIRAPQQIIQAAIENYTTGVKLTSSSALNENLVLDFFGGASNATTIDFNAGSPGGGQSTIIATGTAIGGAPVLFAGTVPTSTTISSTVVGTGLKNYFQPGISLSTFAVVSGFQFALNTPVSSPSTIPVLNPSATQIWTNNANQYNAGVQIGSSGSTITADYKGSGTLTYTAITAATCQEQPLTISGAAAGDVCWASTGASDIGANFAYSGCRISGLSTAQVKVCSAATATPTAVTWTGWARH